MDGDDTIFNAEITMQEVEKVEALRNVAPVKCIRRSRRRRTRGEPVLEEDLAYIMQSAFVDQDPVEDDKQGTRGEPVLEEDLAYIMQSAFIDQDPDEDDEGSESDSCDSDSGDDVRITLVKGKDDSHNDTVIVTISSDEEEVELIEEIVERNGQISHEPNSKCFLDLDTNNTTEDYIVIQKPESDEHVVRRLLNSLVVKTIASLGQSSHSNNESLSSEDETSMSRLRSIVERENRVVNHVPRVPNEVLPEELIAIVCVEEVTLTPKDHLNQLGTINGVVEKMVVVKSNNDAPALDCESAFFFEDHSFLGRVFDTFGPVKVPHYTINLSEKVDSSKLTIGTKVCYVPFNQHLTKYVFVEQLKNLKASDASWSNDCEPPEIYIEYSDNEEEHIAKKEKKRGRDNKSKPPNSGASKEQCRVHLKQNRFDNFHSKGQIVEGNIQQPVKKSNPQGRQYMLGSSMTRVINQPTQPHQLPNRQPLFSNINVSLQEWYDNMQPPVRPGMQPPAMRGMHPPAKPGMQLPAQSGMLPPAWSGVQPPIRLGTQPPIRLGMQPTIRSVMQPPIRYAPPIRPGMQPPSLPDLQSPIRSGLQPLVRPAIQSHSQTRPILNRPVSAIPQPPVEPMMYQNTHFSNGILGNSPLQVPPESANRNQQGTSQNRFVESSQLPVSAAPLQALPGFNNILNNKCNNVLPSNQSFVNNLATVINQLPNTPIQPYGDPSMNPSLPSIQNNIQRNNNLSLGESNLLTNFLCTSSNPRTFPDTSHFSRSSLQDQRNPNSKGDIVKLNGFTFKI